MKNNTDNLRRGREFQELAARELSRAWNTDLELEVPFLIGNPPKSHKFDMASRDRRFVGEAKNFTWTETGNMPSAKIGFVNQAVFYLSFLPSDLKRFVVMPRDIRHGKGEALADYYYRTYRHLLNGVFIVEVDPSTHTVRVLGEDGISNGPTSGKVLRFLALCHIHL